LTFGDLENYLAVIQGELGTVATALQRIQQQQQQERLERQPQPTPLTQQPAAGQ
jgi:hypothetical protein